MLRLEPVVVALLLWRCCCGAAVALLLCASLTTVSTRQVYEDVLRTLLGSNAYILFTLHKIISQASPAHLISEFKISELNVITRTSSSLCTRSSRRQRLAD